MILLSIEVLNPLNAFIVFQYADIPSMFSSSVCNEFVTSLSNFPFRTICYDFTNNNEQFFLFTYECDLNNNNKKLLSKKQTWACKKRIKRSESDTIKEEAPP